MLPFHKGSSSLRPEELPRASRGILTLGAPAHDLGRETDEHKERAELEIGDVVLGGEAISLLPVEVALANPAGVKVVVPDAGTGAPVLMDLAEYMESDAPARVVEVLDRRRADIEAGAALDEMVDATFTRQIEEVAHGAFDDLHGDDEHYFGVCPVCKSNDGYLNIGRDHWVKCDEHKVKWRVGSNLFSGWRDEPEEVWEENARKLSEYEEVEEFHQD